MAGFRVVFMISLYLNFTFQKRRKIQNNLATTMPQVLEKQKALHQIRHLIKKVLSGLISTDPDMIANDLELCSGLLKLHFRIEANRYLPWSPYRKAKHLFNDYLCTDASSFYNKAKFYKRLYYLCSRL